MLTAEIVQQTEARFSQRQAIRQEREAKIRAGAILDADTPERVRERIQHLASRAVETEGVSLPTSAQPTGPFLHCWKRPVFPDARFTPTGYTGPPTGKGS